MTEKEIFMGKTPLIDNTAPVKGDFVEIDKESFYRISNYHHMPDFFLNIVSNADHWMFLSSNGSLTAGRVDRDNALFPYYTVDKIHDYKGLTGSASCFLVEIENKTSVWEPFTDTSAALYHITRSLYKSIYSNKIIFEEENHDLGLTFRYGWYNSNLYGFVKIASLHNQSNQKVSVELLDGIKNILPPGIDYAFQNEYSNLADAYKKNELVENSSIGLFTLSSIPVDRAEPSESLKTTTVWSAGLPKSCQYLLSDTQVDRFKKGHPVQTETDIKATRGAYLVVSRLNLNQDETTEWLMAADVNKEATDVVSLLDFLNDTKNVVKAVREDINSGTRELVSMVAASDGLQLTNTPVCTARHYANTLYNIMRGGLFINGYQIERDDLANYIQKVNKNVFATMQSWLQGLSPAINHKELMKEVEKTDNRALYRIVSEYLPLSFSRRHGDPSRPWNLFHVNNRDDKGNPLFDYEGNWRDIFQNWEALGYAYPQFIEGFISKFLNASTLDGYNPYRITKESFDYEVPEPNNPWAYIGYWGDHQVIYLLKLLELSANFHPGKLDEWLTKEQFVYAHVPYRIKPYAEILQNPNDTITFDYQLNKQINTEVEKVGADARLLRCAGEDDPYTVNLTEKMLVVLLSKLSNFIPEAGIWLNTQRPEWNDANNALVGGGASMVTLYYLRRFVAFWLELLNQTSVSEAPVSEEVADLFKTVHLFLEENQSLIGQGFSNEARKMFADALGSAHSGYRAQIYHHSFSGKKTAVTTSDIRAFLSIVNDYINQSIAANKRSDGLYHSYNLVSFSENAIAIRRLYEMLEGQVAVLSSGFLSPRQSLDVLHALRNSALFRTDQYSYLLYPDRVLPRFLEKNNIPEAMVAQSKLLSRLVKVGDTSIVVRDRRGGFHFNAAFRNANMLKAALQGMTNGAFGSLVKKEMNTVLDIYEAVFDHQSFTGRSGTFFAYEGLGSIYWHMVSKLLLAVAENYHHAMADNASEEVRGKLKEHYYEIKAGIGLYKSPEVYGAFPMDAYSHTPSGAGAKQPGLTGQVKEDIISRLLELGVVIAHGQISFNPELFNPEEMLQAGKVFSYYTLEGGKGELTLKPGEFAFTFCQVPIVVAPGNKSWIEVYYTNGARTTTEGCSLEKSISESLYKREGRISRINVFSAVMKKLKKEIQIENR